jgi:hypothetical protein
MNAGKPKSSVVTEEQLNELFSDPNLYSGIERDLKWKGAKDPANLAAEAGFQAYVCLSRGQLTREGTKRIAWKKARSLAKKESQKLDGKGQLCLDIVEDFELARFGLLEKDSFEEVMKRGFFEVFFTATLRLPPKERAALHLRILFDDSPEDIASMLDCSIRTAYRLIQRAVVRLKRDKALMSYITGEE